MTGERDDTRWPDFALVAAAGLLVVHVLFAALYVAAASRPPVLVVAGPFLLLAGVVSLIASAGPQLRASTRTHLGWVAVVAAYLLLVVVRVSRGGRVWDDEADIGRILVLSAVLLPMFLAEARGNPPRWTLALQAVGGVPLAGIVVWAPLLTHQTYPEPSLGFLGIQLGLVLVLAAGLVGALASYPPSRLRGAFDSLQGSWTTRLLLLGGGLLLYGWTLGQMATVFSFFWRAIWWLPLVVLALPLVTYALTPPYELDAARVTAAALTVLAFVPVGGRGRCLVDWWSDAGGGGVRWTQVFLVELAGHGPLWSSSGGFGGTRVNCQPWLDALAILWVAGLAGASWWVGRGGAEENTDRTPDDPTGTDDL